MSYIDFIPNSDPEFDEWQGNLITLVEPNVETWGIAAADLTSLKTRQTTWVTAHTKASNKQNRSAADVRAKNDARKLYEKDLRKFVSQWLAYNNKVTDTDRERMGLTVKSETRTPVPVPLSAPVPTINFSTLRKHFIYFVDGATNSKAKPQGVQGCEVWIKTGGELPKDDSEFTFLGLDTRSPFVVSFPISDVGKPVYYHLRWINKRGQPGPWSITVNAVVGG